MNRAWVGVEAGEERLATYLRNRDVKGSNKVAHKALAAAKAQGLALPAQEVASRIVAELAKDVLVLKERIEGIDEVIGQRFFARPEAWILTSLPGMGRSSGPRFWWPWATSAPSRAPTDLLLTRV
jgi:hypothetical protein